MPFVVESDQLATFIRELRVLNRQTQEQFAASVGVTASTVNRWENGRSLPSPLARRLLEEMALGLGEKGRTLLDKYAAPDNYMRAEV